jgi:hypothetical protein
VLHLPIFRPFAVIPLFYLKTNFVLRNFKVFNHNISDMSCDIAQTTTSANEQPLLPPVSLPVTELANDPASTPGATPESKSFILSI